MPQCRKKAGPELKTNREDKQNESQLFHEIECVMIDRVAEVTHDNSGKEDAGRPKTNAAKFQAPKRHSDHAYKSENTDSVSNRLRAMKFKKPAHANENAESFKPCETFVRAPSAFGLIEGKAACTGFFSANRAPKFDGREFAIRC